MTFKKLLEKYRKYSFSERDKGDRFERLMQRYLQTEPTYETLFKKVWLWNEFIGKKDLGGQDVGIDLVALTHNGDYWAIQCKCFQEGATIDKPAVDSFLSTSSRKFKNEDLQTVGFSHRLWIDTTGRKWGSNAEEAIRNQDIPVNRITLSNLSESSVDWANLEKGIHGEASRAPKKPVFPHILTVVSKAHDYYKKNERGKLIMACGTGKTIASLKIAEKETDGKGLILFLVPSISLLGQTLREWSAQADEPIHAICICSDAEVTKSRNKNEDTDTFSVVDLALPASTNVQEILHQFKSAKKGHKGMTVVFSTYQSIDVIAKAQKELLKNKFGAFDLIVCDEAHRTTGVTLAAEDSSAFIKVHDNDFLKAKKRLYMTATPRLYSDDAKSKAAQADAVLCSMDDATMYGNEIHRIGFGEAVEHDLLTDYKVLILTLSDKDVPPAVQSLFAGQKNEINTDDVPKLIGCINALSKQVLGDEGILKSSDPEPMRRAVAFCPSIEGSKKIKNIFDTATATYLSTLPPDLKEQTVSVNADHVDGTMSAPQRDALLGWLKEETEGNECRVLTNVRCLSEGVDVPSLDAVLFLSARNSQVDVVQSVGRVMRKAPGKKYGYIIIPVVVPSDVAPDKALDDNDRYRVVWSVLNALRAHDDRFNATINKIELNRKKPTGISVVGTRVRYDEDGRGHVVADRGSGYGNKELNDQLALQFEQLQSVVFARMVQKVGSKPYWEQWAKDIAVIAERQKERIEQLVKQEGKHKKAFDQFLNGLQKNINPGITAQEAIEMLSQHIITKPVFEALFEDYSFVKNNPISVSMQKMLSLLEKYGIENADETLEKFYQSVYNRARDIDNAEAKQRIIIELYDKFFRTAFPKMVEKLGIVYTPVEVVDFIIHSVNDVLQKEFNRSLGDENVHILDPFTGTGTFITRLLQSGLIPKKALPHKYKHEIHANEIVLLAYYIAAVNIENAYHDALQISTNGMAYKTNGKVNKAQSSTPHYESFDGICLTDTFQLGETDGSDKLFSEMFQKNSERVEQQRKAPLRVIIGNPPYSVGQKSANDNAQNQKYDVLDSRIASTYAASTDATNKNSLYDSYIKAFRWSTDRLDPKYGGIVCFVSNGAWIDGNAQDGFRQCLENEFSSIYVFNLRGNQRTSGELSRKEGGKIFGSGSRTPIAITLLVKSTKKQNEKAKIHYYDIGDYHTREEKLAILKKFGSIGNSALQWKVLAPNEHSDWINERNDLFNTFIPIDSDKKFDLKSPSFFVLNSRGNETTRDAWAYNSSTGELKSNAKKAINFYNDQVEAFKKASAKQPKLKATDFIDTNPEKISWSSSLVAHLERGNRAEFEGEQILTAIYRPFYKQHLYFGDKMIHRRGQMQEFFPSPSSKNKVICVSGVGVTKDFSAIITDTLPDLELIGKSQCFPLYYYEERAKQSPGLFDTHGQNEYIRRDGISDFILSRARKQYGKAVTKEDIFYYVYGFLHSPDYRETFANDLKKMLPRLPLVEDTRHFWRFSKAGQALAELHISYESVPAYEGVKVTGAKGGFYEVEKMRFPKKDKKDTIIYNSKIVIEDIPAEAYEYVVNGKSAIEWIMERYQVTVHKESGIKNDPNDWAKEVDNPRYILELLLSVINVSVQTVEIVKGLPEVKFEEAKVAEGLGIFD